MPEDLTNLSQRGPAPEHLSGQGMTQQVSAFAAWLQACSLERPPDNVANGDRSGKTHMGCLHADEHPARGARRAIFLQIYGQSPAHLRWQRQAILSDREVPVYQHAALKAA